MNYVKKNKISSLLKYPGGKEKELKYILSNLPKVINNYYEPFIGGGAVYFAVDCEQYYINDKSKELIELYQMVCKQDIDFLSKLEAINHNWNIISNITDNHKDELISLFAKYKRNNDNRELLVKNIEKFVNKNAEEFNGLLSPTFNVEIDNFVLMLNKSLCNKIIRMERLEREYGELSKEDLIKNIEGSIKSAFYTHFRYLYNNSRVYPEITSGYRTAIYLYIRQYCYSSMFRFNKSGEFNVPYGGISYNRKTLQNKIDLYKDKITIDHLKKTIIGNTDFYDFLKKYPPNKDDFMFLDPPYDTEFSTYDQNEFSKNDQQRLSDYLINECASNFMLVIKNTEYIKKLYCEGTKTKNGGNIYISSFDKKYFVSFQDRNNKDAEHLLITNYELVDNLNLLRSENRK